MDIRAPKPADKVLADFVSRIDAVQPNLLQGVYLTGSIALNDFYSKKSDIDFIVLLKETPTKEILQQFEQIHYKIKRRFGRPNLNGYYATKGCLFEPEPKVLPAFLEGKMYIEHPMVLEKVTLFELATVSLCIFGAPAIALSIPISGKEVIKQLHENINGYWAKWVNQHSSPLSIDYWLLTAVPRLTEWGVLGVGRQLYTLQTGKIASKLSAGFYCLDLVPEKHKDIVQTAITTRKDNRTSISPSLQRRQKTIDCMRYIIDTFNQNFKSTYEK